MSNALVLMTGLPVTMGHKNLIDFALSFAGSVQVLINSRSFEPIPGNIRYASLVGHYLNNSRVEIIHCDKDDVPQNPTEHSDFWNYWKDLIREYTDNQPGDFVIASELYGLELAKVLECQFIPYDVARQTNPISGTVIRRDPSFSYHELLPEMRRFFQYRVTFFGAESTGKSTCSKNTAEVFGMRNRAVTYVPEWAREYLEICGPEVTEEKMGVITKGQGAAQRVAWLSGKAPFIIQDTDLLSTIGYYRIFMGKETEAVRRAFEASKSDLYVMMPSENPFQEDILRYGGNVRESKDEFWIDLLEEFDCKYVKMPFMSPGDQAKMVYDKVIEEYAKKYEPLAKFVRT